MPTRLGIGRHYVFHGTSHGMCGVDLHTKCISLVLDLPIYIVSSIGLISFPAGIQSVDPPLAVTSLCYYNIGKVTNRIGLLVISSS